jgi:hypothetical protein
MVMLSLKVSGSFKLSGIELSTTTSGPSSRNMSLEINLNSVTCVAHLTFVHEIDDSTTTLNLLALMLDGKLGLGTDSPSSNIHIYNTTSGNVDLFET